MKIVFEKKVLEQPAANERELSYDSDSFESEPEGAEVKRNPVYESFLSLYHDEDEPACCKKVHNLSANLLLTMMEKTAEKYLPLNFSCYLVSFIQEFTPEQLARWVKALISFGVCANYDVQTWIHLAAKKADPFTTCYCKIMTRMGLGEDDIKKLQPMEKLVL